jgi:hypothetical protein
MSCTTRHPLFSAVLLFAATPEIEDSCGERAAAADNLL